MTIENDAMTILATASVEPRESTINWAEGALTYDSPTITRSATTEGDCWCPKRFHGGDHEADCFVAVCGAADTLVFAFDLVVGADHARLIASHSPGRDLGDFLAPYLPGADDEAMVEVIISGYGSTENVLSRNGTWREVRDESGAIIAGVISAAYSLIHTIDRPTPYRAPSGV